MALQLRNHSEKLFFQLLNPGLTPVSQLESKVKQKPETRSHDCLQKYKKKVFASDFSPVHLDEDVAAVDVGLRVVVPHGDGLLVQPVSLLQPRPVPRDEGGQVEKDRQVVRRYPGLVRLAGLRLWEQRLGLERYKGKKK